MREVFNLALFSFSTQQLLTVIWLFAVIDRNNLFSFQRNLSDLIIYIRFFIDLISKCWIVSLLYILYFQRKNFSLTTNHIKRSCNSDCLRNDSTLNIIRQFWPLTMSCKNSLFKLHTWSVSWCNGALCLFYAISVQYMCLTLRKTVLF